MSLSASNAIFIAFDERYALYARTCLNSLARNYVDHPSLFVYYDGANEETLEFLRSFPRVHLLRKDDLVAIDEDANLGVVGNKAVYHKYSAWSPFFSDFEKVLYLDVDTLILKPLDALFAMKTAYVAPNREVNPSVRVFSPKSLSDQRLRKLLETDRIPDMSGIDDMCNAGVLMLPRSERQPAHLQKLKELTVRYNEFLRYADQSAISIWFHLNNLEFSSRFEFNFQSTLFDSPGLEHFDLNNICILHFSSPMKPNTVEFMTWPRVSLARRKQLGKLFIEYARIGTCLHA